MKRLRQWAVVAAVTLVAVVYAAWNGEWLFYTTDQFHGDGTIRLNKGHWPYPDWYSIGFHPVPLDKPGSYRFSFRGVPPGKFSFHLQFPLGPHDSDARYADLKTHLGVTLSQVEGPVLGAGSSALNHGWHLSQTGSDAQFYHWNTYKLSLRGDRTYELRLTITDVDPKTPRVDALPLLETPRS